LFLKSGGPGGFSQAEAVDWRMVPAAMERRETDLAGAFKNQIIALT